MFIEALFYIILYGISIPLALRTLKLISAITKDDKKLEWIAFVPIINSALAVVALLVVCSEELSDVHDLMKRMMSKSESEKTKQDFDEHA